MDIPRKLIYMNNKRGTMMIEYDNFKEIVCGEIKKKLVIDGFNVKLKIDEVNTINKKKDKLSVIDTSTPDVFPTFYMNDLYSFYEECGDLYTVIDDVVSEAKKAYNNIEKINFNKEELCEKAFFTIINCEKNKDFLENIPHRKFQNLSIIYRVKITDTSNAVITNKIAKDLNVSENELYSAAYKNTPKNLGDICMMDLDGWYVNELRKLFNDNPCSYHKSIKAADDEKNKIFVFKYENNSSFGSSVILYKDALEETAENLKDDLVMAFPSSDELIVTSAGNGIEELKNLCDNNTNLSQKFLSNNIYIYNRREKNISIENEMNQTLQLQSNDSRNAVHRKRI